MIGMRFLFVLLGLLAGLAPALPLPACAEGEGRLRIALPVDGDLRAIGWLVARDKGFFTASGIEIDLAPVEAGLDPLAQLAAGKADLAIATMAEAMAARERGLDILNIAQIFQRPSQRLICRPGLAKPQDLIGRTIGLWFGGWQSAPYAWLQQAGIAPIGGSTGVAINWQDRDARDFLAGKLDCYTSATYLMPLQLAERSENRNDFVVIDYQDYGLGALEDGLYIRAADLHDEGLIDSYARFLLALERGYRLVASERAIGLKALRAGNLARRDAKKADLEAALDAVLGALALDRRPFGELDPRLFDDTILLLMTGTPDPIIKAAPKGAFSDRVRRRAAEIARLP